MNTGVVASGGIIGGFILGFLLSTVFLRLLQHFRGGIVTI